MLKLSTSFSKKIPVPDQDFSSQSYRITSGDLPCIGPTLQQQLCHLEVTSDRCGVQSVIHRLLRLPVIEEESDETVESSPR